MLSAATLPVLDKSFRLDDSQCWCLLYYALICDGVRRLFLPERISERKEPGRPKRRRRTLLHWWRRLTGLPILCGFISVRPVRKPWATKSGIPAIIDWQKSPYKSVRTINRFDVLDKKQDNREYLFLPTIKDKVHIWELPANMPLCGKGNEHKL